MARPVFTDVTPAEERELAKPAPRTAVQPPPVPLEDAPIPVAPATAGPANTGEPVEVLPPPNVQRQPVDSPPPNSLAKDAAQSKEMVSIEEAFNKADQEAALEAAKSPEQKEADRLAAEEKAKTEAVPAAPVVEPPVTTAQTDETIAAAEAALKDPATKAARRKDISRLLTSLRAEKTPRSEYEAKVKELEGKVAAPTAVDTAELTKLREENARLADERMKFQRIAGLQDDTEVAKRFEAPVKAAEEAISKVLTGYSLGQPTLDLIAKEGGFAAFSKSGKMLSVPVEQDDPDNPGQRKIVRVQKSASDITREWLNSMAPADAEAIREGMREQIAAQRQKQKYIEDEGAKAREFYANQKQQATAQTAEQAEAAKKIAAEYEKWVGETEAKTEWLKEQSVAVDATPDQKKAAEEHNKFVGEAKAFLKKPPSTVQEYQQLVFDAAEARHLRRTAPQAQARIKELEAQLARVQGASSTTPKRGSIMATPPSPTTPREKKFDPMRDDPADRLAAEFAKVAAGG